MHRESVFVCTYSVAEEEYVGHVRAWDAREAAELFARELEIDCLECGGGGCVAVDEIRVCPAAGRALGTVAA